MDPKKHAQASARREANRPDESENRYQRIFETAQEGILILEADTGQITDVNHQRVIQCNIRDITERKLAEEALRQVRDELEINVSGQGSLPANVRVALYRLCQEALNNIARHAEPSQVEIDLRHETGGVELHIRDNGSGFDPGQPPPAGHFGLSMMHARAEAVGAMLKIISQPGHGTDIAIRWKEAPIKETETP